MGWNEQIRETGGGKGLEGRAASSAFFKIGFACFGCCGGSINATLQTSGIALCAL